MSKVQPRDRQNILWLDNDPGYIYGFVEALKRAGFLVDVVRSVTAAEALLRNRSFDLVLIDVMVPLTEAERDAGYSAAVTDEGHKTGLEFYRRNRETIDEHGLAVALTVRVDKAIRDEFIAAGLPSTNFLTKLEVRDAGDFVATITKQIEGKI